MVQRGSDPVSGPSNEFYSNFPFTAHQSRIVPRACCVNPLAQHPVVNTYTKNSGNAQVFIIILSFELWSDERYGIFVVLYNPPVLSTCPLHTNGGCGKERRILIGPW